MHIEAEQSKSDRISAAYVVSSGLEGHTNIYIGAIFLSVKTTSFGSIGSEDPGASLRDDIKSWIIRDNRTTGTIGQQETLFDTSVIQGTFLVFNS